MHDTLYHQERIYIPDAWTFRQSEYSVTYTVYTFLFKWTYAKE
jgi:hypothetical protein